MEDLGTITEIPQQDVLPVKKIMSSLRDVVEVLIMSLVLIMVVNFFTVRVEVVGVSMNPTLHDGEKLLVYRMVLPSDEYQRGDIIIFDHPNGEGKELVKRIIGLPGDIVTITEDHKVYINGELLDEPYILLPQMYEGEWGVPSGSYFVLGDNRPASLDSHVWGFLPKDYIRGKVILRYSPFDKIEWLVGK